MMSIKFNNITILIYCILIMLICIQCEEYLPDDYQQQDYEIADRDALACDYISRDLFKTDTVIVGDDTSTVTNPMFVSLSTSLFTDILDTSQTSAATDSAIVVNNFQDLVAGMDLMVADTTIVIVNSSGADTSYLCYNHAVSGKKAYFYIGWKFKWLTDLNDDNIGTYIDIDLVNEQAEIVAKNIEHINLEMSASCTQYFERDNNFYPTIKGCNEFAPDQSNYLVRFIFQEPTKIDSFNVSILHE